MKIHAIASFSIAILIAASSQVALAALIPFGFSGRVTEVSPYDWTGAPFAAGAPFAVGDAIAGTFDFEPNASLYPMGPNDALYLSAAQSMQTTIGSYTVTGNGRIQISNYPAGSGGNRDSYFIDWLDNAYTGTTINGVPVQGFALAEMALSFLDPGAAALQTTELLAPALTGFSTTEFTLYFGGGELRLLGVLDSIGPTATVIEPGSLALIGVSLAALGIMRRRGKSATPTTIRKWRLI